MTHLNTSPPPKKAKQTKQKDRSVTTATAAAPETPAAPAFNFAAQNNTTVDLFAPAPQVKKLTRRDRHRLLREIEVQRATGTAATREGGTAAGSSAASLLAAAATATGSNRFQAIFDTKEVEQQLATEEARREKKSHGKKQILRHALHPNEEEDARTVFVGNLPNTIQKRAVEKLFKPCGAITAVRIRCQVLEEVGETDKKDVGRAVRVLRGEIKKGDRLSSTAYVLFESAESIASALGKNGLVFHNRHLVVTTLDAESAAYRPETSIFLGNIAYDTTEEDVWGFFQEKGVSDVKRVRLVRDRETGACRGFGYVEFMRPASVEAAIATRGSLLNQRPVRIVHVNKSKDVKAQTTSRREKRREERSSSRGPPQKQQRQEIKRTGATSELPPWAGVATNPRRKMPRDLRPLVEGKVEFKARGPRAPVKRKVRNPEK